MKDYLRLNKRLKPSPHRPQTRWLSWRCRCRRLVAEGLPGSTRARSASTCLELTKKRFELSLPVYSLFCCFFYYS